MRHSYYDLRLTAEQIAARAEHLDGRANVAAINRLYRQQEDQELIEKAIRLTSNDYRDGGWERVGGLEYAMHLEHHMSQIVNAKY